MNEYAWQRISVLAGRQALLLSTVKRSVASCHGSAMSVVMNAAKIIQGTADGSRRG